jgi:hypothetical protein
VLLDGGNDASGANRFRLLNCIPREHEDEFDRKKGENMKRMLAIGLLSVVVVTGCGGGGSNGDDSGTSAEGLWNGTTSNGRAMSGLVLDDGTYWVLYSLMGNSAVIAGGVQGTGSSRNGTFTSSNGRDFNLEGLGVNDVDVSANYVMEESLSGSVRYTGHGRSGVVLRHLRRILRSDSESGTHRRDLLG